MGIAETYFLLGNGKHWSGYGTKSAYRVTSDKWFCGSQTFRVNFSSDDLPGEWHVLCIFLKDSLGNWSEYRWVDSPDDGFDSTSGYMDSLHVYRDGAYFASGNFSISVPNIDTTLTVTSEYDIAAQYSIDNPRLASLCSDLNENQSVKIKLTDTTICDKEVFKSIAGKNVNLIFYKDAYQWVINGKNIIESGIKDIDFNVVFKQVKSGEYGGNNDSIEIVFPSNGKLPGKMQFRLKSNYMYTLHKLSNILYLYYMTGNNANLETNNVKYILDGKDHWCKFDITHNSRFFLSSEKLKNRTEISLKSKTVVYNGYTKSIDKATIKGSTGKVTYTYYTNSSCTVKTSPSKSGSTSTGSAPKNSGVYFVKATVAADSKYAKTTSKAVKFIIKPKATVVSSVKNTATRTVTVKWKKNVSASGYQVQYKLGTSVKTKTITKNSILYTKLIKLSKNKKYKVRIRAYKTVSNGKLYSSWSSYKSVKITR